MSKILVEGKEHEVGDKPITLLCHKGDVSINPTTQVEIGPEQTIARTAALDDEDWHFLRTEPIFVNMFTIVFPDRAMPAAIHAEGMGLRHVVGLIVLLLETRVAGKQPYIRFPESYLHPSSSRNLADLFVYLSKARP